MTKPNITLIAAMDFHLGIGKNNQLPWKLPEDLKRFKEITTGHPIVMGRKTFDSIGKPLPNRHNIVVTRNLHWEAGGVSRFLSPEDVLQYYGNYAQEVFVIGGAEIYKQFIPHANRMLLTRIFDEFDCDSFFPKYTRDLWNEISREQHTSKENEFDYAFIEYRRKE